MILANDAKQLGDLIGRLGSTHDVRDRLGLPFSAPRRGDSARIQGGGDLTKRLRAGRLSLGNEGRDAGGVSVRLGLVGGVGDGAGLRQPARPS